MKIQLDDPDKTLDIDIVGYEYPLEKCFLLYDANWLVMKITYEDKSLKEKWSRKDPSLLTDELEHLASWLRSIAKYDRDLHSISNVWSGSEPTLSIFHLYSYRGKHTFMFTLKHEFLPKGEYGSQKNLYAKIKTKDLLKLAGEFRKLSKKYPEIK